MLGLTRFLILVFSVVSITAHAESVEFTSRELDAIETLMKPETAVLRFHGQAGSFDPPRSFRIFGVEPESFPINMSVILDLLDLRFDRVVGHRPSFQFTPEGFEVQLNFENRIGALRSHLGRIDIRNVRVTAVLDWRERSGGKRELALKTMRFAGTLKGKGIMGTRPVINRTKKLAMKLFGNQVEKVLAKEEIQNAIRNGLSTWAKMTVGDVTVMADPTTFAFSRRENSTSLTFETISP